MQLIFQQLAPHHLKSATQLINTQYRRQKSLEYFKWRYFSPEQPSQLWGAFFGQNLAGMLGTQSRKLSSGKSIQTLTDMITNHKYRRQGILTSLVHQTLPSEENTSARCSFTNHQGMLALTQGLGWQLVSTIENLILKAPFHLKKVRSNFQLITTSLTRFVYSDQIKKWRFNRSPLYDYHVIGSSQAQVVLKIFTNPETKQLFGDIVHWKYQSTSSYELQSLIKQVINFFTQKRVATLTTWAPPHTSLRRFLVEIGFQPQPAQRYFCFKPIQRNSHYLANPTSWFLCQADSEIY